MNRRPRVYWQARMLDASGEVIRGNVAKRLLPGAIITKRERAAEITAQYELESSSITLAIKKSVAHFINLGDFLSIEGKTYRITSISEEDRGPIAWLTVRVAYDSAF